MRWYFKEHGWPSSTIFEVLPESDSDMSKLIDDLQDWKAERYKAIIKSGTVKPRPGVLRLMDEAKAAERFQSLDCFLAGDDVKEKKPSPSIYLTALKAATGAGISCVITYTSSTAEHDFSNAIAIYPDLSDVFRQALLQNNVVIAS